MTPLLGTVLLYMVAQLAIGVWVSRRVHTEADYLIAGRQLGYTLTTASIFATWFGAETVVGAAATVATDGISLASAEPFGYALCLMLMGAIFAGPLWRRKLTTLADLFRVRYSVRVERVAALILIPSSVLWAAAQMRAFGQVLTTASALTLELAIAAAAAFVVLYSMFGGMLADAITDMIQGAMLVLGLVVLFTAVVIQQGGVGATAEAIAGSGLIRIGSTGGASTLEMMESWAIPVFGSVMAAELVSRVISARSPEVARRSSFAGGGLYLLVGLIPVTIGVLGTGMVAGLGDPEQLIPAIARDLLPTVGYAIFAGGLISAILSTADSTLLVSSGLLSHNLLVPTFKIERERTKLLLARLGVAAFGLVALLLAVRAEGVFALVEQASAFGSAGVLVTVCFGLFTGFGGPRTALATLVAGMATYIGGSAAGFAYPFLLSLAVALATYVAGGFSWGQSR